MNARRDFAQSKETYGPDSFPQGKYKNLYNQESAGMMSEYCKDARVLSSQRYFVCCTCIFIIFHFVPFSTVILYVEWTPLFVFHLKMFSRLFSEKYAACLMVILEITTSDKLTLWLCIAVSTNYFWKMAVKNLCMLSSREIIYDVCFHKRM